MVDADVKIITFSDKSQKSRYLLKKILNTWIFRVNIHAHQIESTILIKVDIAIIRMTSSILASFFLQLMKIEIPDFVIESKLIYSVS